MRKSILAVAGLIAAFGGTAHADGTVLASGPIIVGNPNGAALGGLSEMIGLCGGDESFNGIDGIAFDVPVDVVNTGATLVTAGSAAIDADVYWYDGGCELIEDLSMASLGEADEAGIVPENAVYGAVDLILGADAHVTLTAGL